jgi:hypothetical protein
MRFANAENGRSATLLADQIFGSASDDEEYDSEEEYMDDNVLYYTEEDEQTWFEDVVESPKKVRSIGDQRNLLYNLDQKNISLSVSTIFWHMCQNIVLTEREIFF